MTAAPLVEAPLLTGPVPVRRSAGRTLLASALALASVVALFVSAAAFAEVRFLDFTEFFPAAGSAALWLLLGGVLLGVSLWLSPWRLPFMQPAREVETPRIAWLPLLAGVILLGVGTVAGGRLLGDAWVVSVHIQFGLLLAGALLTGWALSGAPRRFAALPGRELALVGALTVLALALRLIDVTVSTPGLMDEIHFVYGISFIQNDANLPLLRQASTFLPANEIYSYWQTLVLSVTGESLEGLRLVSALVGALTVPIVYLLARSLFDRRTAFAAALLLATFAPHLFYSRLGYAQIADAMFGALMLALLAYGLCSGTRWPWAWAGVALGMTQYFYEGGRLLFPPVALALFLFLFVVYGPRRMRPYLRGMGVMLLAAVLIAAPMYVTMAATSAPFSSRFNDSGAASGLIDAVRAYEQQDPFMQYVTASRFVNPFLSYVALPDSTGAFYGEDQPMVLPVLVPLLLLGVWHTLWRLRSPAMMLLLVVLGGAAGNVLVQETLWYPRYVMVMPLLPVLMAAGLRYTVPLLWPRPMLPTRPRLRAIGAALVPALAVLAAVIQIIYFFGPFREAYAVSFRDASWAPDSNDAVLRAVALPDPASRQVILVSRDGQDRNVPDGFFGFLTDGGFPLLTVTEADFTDGFIANLPRDRSYAFFLEPAATDAYARLAAAFPLGAPDYSTRPFIPASSTYLMFIVPPQEPPAK